MTKGIANGAELDPDLSILIRKNECDLHCFRFESGSGPATLGHACVADGKLPP